MAGGLSAAYAVRFAAMAYAPGDRTEAARPSLAATGASAVLVTATLALSTLWLPAVHGTVAGALGAALPQTQPALTVASLAAVALGAGAGLRLARHPQARGAEGWLGLTPLIAQGIARPTERLARLAARIDDSLIDALPRGMAGVGRALASRLARSDDSVLDGLPGGAALTGRTLARRLSRADTSLLDGLPVGAALAGQTLAQRLACADTTLLDGMPRGQGAVALVVRAASGLARAAGRTGEAVADLLPGAPARLLGMAGADARRLQTGMAHHYYAVLVALAGLGALVLIVGA
jgi:hypothetical protein